MQLACKDCGSLTEAPEGTTKILCDDCRIKKGDNPRGKRNYDTDDFIYCRICNVVKRQLREHIRKNHKMTIEDYQEKYSNAPIFSKATLIKKSSRSEETKKKMSRTAKTNWTDPKIRRKREESHVGFTGQKHTEEEKRKIAQSVTETKALQKPQTEIRRIARKKSKKAELDEYVICPICFRETHDEILSRLKFISYGHVQTHGYTVEQFKEEFPDHPLKIESLGEEHSKAISGKKHFNYGKELTDDIKENISKSVADSWDDHNETKDCIKCGQRMAARNENDICTECREKLFAFQDTEEYVYCRICNLVKKNLGAHIIRIHKMTTKEYKRKYNAPICCEELKEKLTEHHFKKISDSHSKSLKTKQAQNKIDKQQWEDNFKIEDYQYLVDRQIPNYLIDTEEWVYCRICLETKKQISPQHLATHKFTTKMYQKLFPEAPIFSPKVAKFIGQKNFQTKLDSGQMEIGKSYGYGGKRNDICDVKGNHYVRSMLEANFARILKLNNIEYEYESETFKLSNSKFSIITPDFRLRQDFHIWKKGDFVETKGFCDDDTHDKIEDFENQYPQYRHYLLIQGCDVWKELEELYKAKIDLWEDSKRNIKTDPEIFKLKGDSDA